MDFCVGCIRDARSVQAHWRGRTGLWLSSDHGRARQMDPGELPSPVISLSLSTQMLLLCVWFCANDVVWCLQFTVLGSSLFMKLRICSLSAAAVSHPNPPLALLYLRMYQRGHFRFNSSQVFAWPCLFKMTKGRVLIEFASWVQGVIWDLAQPVQIAAPFFLSGFYFSPIFVHLSFVFWQSFECH